MEYDHWLVTKGKDRHSVRKHGLVPIVLVHQHVGMSELARLVRIEVDKRICVFLDDTVPSIEVLRASTRPYVVDLISNLWLSAVRLSDINYTQEATEEAIIWGLRGIRRAPEWQGPADGVISPSRPATLRQRCSMAPFKIIDD
jgi:hypothetical protein